MIKINLLPKDVQEKGKGMEWVVLGVAALLIFAGTGVFHYTVKLAKYKRDSLRKASWNAQLSRIKAEVAKVEQLDAQKNLLNAKKSTVVLLLQGRLLYSMFMEHFFETLPRDVWITDLKISEDAAKNIKIDATSTSVTIESVADWLQTLESKPERFSGVSLNAIDLKQGVEGKANTYTFTMSFTYRPPPLGA